MQGVRLYKTNLQGANLIGACLHVASLENAQLEDATLAYADLQLADLSSAQFDRAFMYDAILREAVLNLTDFTDARLHRAQLQGAQLYRTILHGAKLYEAILNGSVIVAVEFDDDTDLSFSSFIAAAICGVKFPEGDEDNGPYGTYFVFVVDEPATWWIHWPEDDWPFNFPKLELNLAGFFEQWRDWVTENHPDVLQYLPDFVRDA
jgi:hypothetical protein